MLPKLIKCEYIKLKRRFFIPFIFLLSFTAVFLQSYAGFKTLEIPTKVLYVTGLDLFVGFIFPVIISATVSLSCWVDTENDGTLNLLLRRVTFKKIYISKWISNVLMLECLYILSFTLTMVFTFYRNGSPFQIVFQNIVYILASMITVILLINLTYSFIFLFRSYILPIVWSVVASFIGSLLSSSNLVILNPWAYLQRLFSISTLSNFEWFVMGIVFIISIVLTICLFDYRLTQKVK
jgi:hypothetical protein